MFQTEVAEKIKHKFYILHFFFFENLFFFEIMWKYSVQPGSHR